jgi:hypothetical protein
MTNKSDIELQEWIQEHQAPDYANEEVQKRTIIGHDMGSEISLYAWIHRYDNAESASILSLDEVSKLLADEFRGSFIEEMTNG